MVGCPSFGLAQVNYRCVCLGCSQALRAYRTPLAWLPDKAGRSFFRSQGATLASPPVVRSPLSSCVALPPPRSPRRPVGSPSRRSRCLGLLAHGLVSHGGRIMRQGRGAVAISRRRGGGPGLLARDDRQSAPRLSSRVVLALIRFPQSFAYWCYRAAAACYCHARPGAACSRIRGRRSLCGLRSYQTHLSRRRSQREELAPAIAARVTGH